MRTFDQFEKIKLEDGYTYPDLSGFVVAPNADFLSEANKKWGASRDEKIKIYHEIKKFEERCRIDYFDSVKIFDVVKIGNSCTIGDDPCDYEIFEVTIFDEEGYISDFEYSLECEYEDLPDVYEHCTSEYIISKL